jgi:hypothetical protein
MAILVNDLNGRSQMLDSETVFAFGVIKLASTISLHTVGRRVRLLQQATVQLRTS